MPYHEHIVTTHDLPYADTDHPQQRLDVHRPVSPTAKRLPAIVYIHGGAWQEGDRNDGHHAAPLVATGDYISISIGYRFSNEVKWPVQLHDCKAALRWVRANASEFGIDPARVAVWGDSAGGHLALMCGMTGDLDDLEGEVGPYRGQSTAVSCVANWYGVTDFLAEIGEPSFWDRAEDDAPEAQLIGGRLTDHPELARHASPITYVVPGVPPVLTMHSTDDWMVPYSQATRLHDALEDVNATHYLITVFGGGHGRFGPATDRAAAFFARHLHNSDVQVATQPLKHFPAEDGG